MLDILQPVVLLMIRAQTVNLPPWKMIAWHSRVTALLQKLEKELKKVKKGSQPSKFILPKLAKHWQEINAGRRGNNEDEQKPGTFQVIKYYIKNCSNCTNFQSDNCTYKYFLKWLLTEVMINMQAH